MNQHPLGQHTPECSDPTNCGEYAAVLAMTPTQHADYINESTARFAQQRTARQFRESQQQEDFTPPSAYGPALAARAASERQTSEEVFAVTYADERTAAFNAEYDVADVHPAPRVMSAAELAEFDPPDPWTEGIKALQAKAQKGAK